MMMMMKNGLLAANCEYHQRHFGFRMKLPVFWHKMPVMYDFWMIFGGFRVILEKNAGKFVHYRRFVPKRHQNPGKVILPLYGLIGSEQ